MLYCNYHQLPTKPSFLPNNTDYFLYRVRCNPPSLASIYRDRLVQITHYMRVWRETYQIITKLLLMIPLGDEP